MAISSYQLLRKNVERRLGFVVSSARECRALSKALMEVCQAAVSETTIKIHPYSYNAEILNPAYLKHVAVVNVIKGDASAQDGDADCKAELDAINALENMNQPINGSIHEIEISGLKSGYTYQFAYTAMDYTGVIVTKRNAICVK